MHGLVVLQHGVLRVVECGLRLGHLRALGDVELAVYHLGLVVEVIRSFVAEQLAVVVALVCGLVAGAAPWDAHVVVRELVDLLLVLEGATLLVRKGDLLARGEPIRAEALLFLIGLGAPLGLRLVQTVAISLGLLLVLLDELDLLLQGGQTKSPLSHIVLLLLWGLDGGRFLTGRRLLGSCLLGLGLLLKS